MGVQGGLGRRGVYIGVQGEHKISEAGYIGVQGGHGNTGVYIGVQGETWEYREIHRNTAVMEVEGDSQKHGENRSTWGCIGVQGGCKEVQGNF